MEADRRSTSELSLGLSSTTVYAADTPPASRTNLVFIQAQPVEREWYNVRAGPLAPQFHGVASSVEQCVHE